MSSKKFERFRATLLAGGWTRIIGPFCMWLGCVLITVMPQAARGQAEKFAPIAQVDAGGHTSRVMSLCFNRAGDELWSAGWDKSVRLWKRDDAGNWQTQPDQTVYVPQAAGLNGVIDNIAISSDDRHLAIGGYGRIANAPAFRDAGVSRLPGVEQWLDQGVILLYDRHTQQISQLRGHRGPVRKLAFSPGATPSVLASIGFESKAQNGAVSNGGGLRLWDVNQRRELASMHTLPAPGEASLQFLPPERGSWRVATNWGQGKGMIWDGRTTTAFATDASSQLLAASHSSPILVTGGMDSRGQGQLTFWNNEAGRAPRKQRSATFSNEVANGVTQHFLPLKAHWFQSGTNNTDYLAVVALVWKAMPQGAPNQAISYELRTLEVVGLGNSLKQVSRLGLWPTSGNSGLGAPSLICSPVGNVLAVANGSTGEITTFAVDRLLLGQTNSQRLTNRLLPVQQANFVTQRDNAADRSGLRIGLAIQTPQSKFVLDILSGGLTISSTQQWQPIATFSSDWSVRNDGPRGQFILHQGRSQKIQLPTGLTYLSSYFARGAKVDQASTEQLPTLVVAAEEQGQPWLGVIDARTGQVDRLLSGHTNRILHLAGSSDGRFLVSTSADQTVALWDLTRVSTADAQHSTFNGIALSAEDNKVNVDVAEPTSGLRVGDKLVGLVDQQALHSWHSTKDAYDAVWSRSPDSEIVVRIQRNSATQDVKLKLRRATGADRPICQFVFLERAGRPQWIAWSPTGYYDVSTMDIRSMLGWLFNPTDASDRVSFVGVDQYPELFLPGLLKELWLEPQQDLTAYSLRRIEPALALTFGSRAPMLQAQDGLEVIESAQQIVELLLSNEFPRDELGEAKLLLDDEPLGAMQTTGRSWTATLGQRLRPGTHRLVAEVFVPRLRRSFSTHLPFHFIPPAPVFNFSAPPAKQTKEASVALAATATSSVADLSIGLILEKVSDTGETSRLKEWRVDASQEFSVPLNLDIGLNRYQILARHADLDLLSDLIPSSQVQLTIERHAPDQSPPALNNVSVSAVRAEMPAPTLLSSQVYESVHDTVLLSGTIAAKEALEEIKIGGQVPQRFSPKAEAIFEFLELTRLRPGLNRIAITARTTGKGEASNEVLINYAPPLPSTEIQFPPPEYEVVQQLDVPRIQLVLNSRWQPFAQPAQITISSQGAVIAQQHLDDASSFLPETWAPLQLGKNVILVELVGTKDGRRETRSVNCYYYPPPKLLTVQAPQTTRDQNFRVSATVMSDTPIQRIRLDDQEVPKDKWSAVVSEGQHSIDVDAVAHGTDRRLRTLSVYAEGVPYPAIQEFQQPQNLGPIKPPKIVWISPAGDKALTEPRVMVKFEVISFEPLAEVRFNDRPLPLIDGVRASNDTLVYESEVTLTAGANSLRIEAHNAGGIGTRNLTLQRLLPPGYVKSVSLKLADGTQLRPQESSAAQWQFDKAVSMGAGLEIQFDVRADDAGEAWISVNGFRRRVPPIAQSKVGLIQYRCPVQLSRQKDNRIELQTVLPTARSAKTAVVVDCDLPSPLKQRLHFALIGIGVTDEDQFMQEAIRSVSGSELKNVDLHLHEFKAKAFEHCFAYGPYVGNEISAKVINTILTDDIPNHLGRQSSDEEWQDVILIYYRGGEQVFQRNEFYLTTQAPNAALDELMRTPRWLKSRGISSTYLSEVLNQLQGAHVMMLDVRRTAGQGESTVSEISSFAPSAATYRFAWTGPPQVPEDARLLTASRVAMPKIENLGQFEQELGRVHAQISARHGELLRYEHSTPAGLHNVVLRR